MARVKRDGVVWEAVPGQETLLERILAAPGRAIKEERAKWVTVHQVEGVKYYVKHCSNQGISLRWMEQFFKPSPFRYEWELARRMEALGLRIIRHLAFGERRSVTGLQESLLITEGCDGKPLDTHPSRNEPDIQRRLGKLLRLCHDRGVLVRDPQRSILVRRNPLDGRRVNLQHAIIKPSLTEQERLENLACLDIFVPLGNDFFGAYGADKAFITCIKRRASLLRRPLAEDHARRCLGRGAFFEAHELGGLRWWVRRGFYEDKLRRLLAAPDDALRQCSRLFKSRRNWRTTVGAFDGLVLKRYNQVKRWDYVKDLFRSSRAFRAYRNAYHLELLGIAAPLPIAVAEVRVCRVLLRSYLVMQEVHDTTDLRSLQQPDRALIRRFAELVARLHGNGFIHGDLKETNVVWNAAGQVYLLDLDGLRYLRRVPDSRAMACLGRLARAASRYPIITRADRIAFLRVYCRLRGWKRIPRAA